MQELGLHRHRQLADFVQEQSSAVGLRKEPLPRPVCARECTLGVTEKLALQELLGNRAAVDGDELPPASRALRLNRLGENAFPGAAFTDDQHGAVRGRDLVGQPFHALHRGRSETECRGRLLADDATERAVFLAQPAHRIDLREPMENLFVAHRFRKVVEGPGSQRLHHGRNGRTAGYHYEDRFELRRAGLPQQIESVTVRHRDVA